ncbi:uncharacterized protein F5Z01DRAFT_429461 [Emericellopsis atlantica]|uniref:NmrA-like domain-containing protein n=1 Tax=Emericellopsis atlantica TaxID=2614577 RepID=A0A9P7ZDC5_9HYPO|nr:uncharacterized protein F5Z01DRAFT_429461 [Emericellopsis atlantica]KAG9250039.1 hypothetical protein F5Z01DRAFT_429461 [Emericellopsis atlantica]
MTASKLLVVIGITGTQGSSVANALLQSPEWHIRGISRNPSSAAAKLWTSKGVQMVKADLDDVTSLEAAFSGATAIFAVTDFYNLVFSPVHAAAAHEAGMAPNEYARNIETKQGINIATAANSPVVSATLTHFVFSSLSDTKRWSGGKYTWNFHFDGKADVVKHIKQKVPDLAAKMSTVQVGMYASNWKGGMGRPQKQEDGSFVVQIPDVGETKLPWIFVQRDTGVYVKALLENETGKDILAFSEMATWREFWELWSSIRGVKLRVQVVSVESFFQFFPEILRREFQESLRYITEFGYTGGDPDVCGDLQELSPNAKATSLREYIGSEDWSSLE